MRRTRRPGTSPDLGLLAHDYFVRVHNVRVGRAAKRQKAREITTTDAARRKWRPQANAFRATLLTLTMCRGRCDQHAPPSPMAANHRRLRRCGIAIASAPGGIRRPSSHRRLSSHRRRHMAAPRPCMRLAPHFRQRRLSCAWVLAADLQCNAVLQCNAMQCDAMQCSVTLITLAAALGASMQAQSLVGHPGLPASSPRPVPPP